MTAIQGLRGTGQFTTDFRPTNYRELFTLLEPNGTAPLQALLAMTSSESTDDPKYNHFRDELPDRTLVTASAATNSATSVVYTNDDDEAFILAGRNGRRFTACCKYGLGGRKATTSSAEIYCQD